MVPCVKNFGASSPAVSSTGIHNDSGHVMPRAECPLVALIHNVGLPSSPRDYSSWRRAFAAPELPVISAMR
eukprot:3960211-Pyramimonas_sp.AAC.1